jgi:hypothetical protein
MMIEVRGRDIQVLENLTTEIKDSLQGIPELFNLKTT